MVDSAGAAAGGADFWAAEVRRFLPDASAALAEARQYVCCPVCKVLADVAFRHLAALPSRWAEEAVLRDAVCRAGGLCHAHTWRLSRMQGSLPIARAFIEVLAGRLAAGMATSPCPLCHLQRLVEGELLDALFAWLADPAARERYRLLFGLCYPHYERALGREPDAEVRTALVEAQRSHTAELVQQLRGFIEKNDPQRRGERSDDETRAPRRALLKAAGNEDL